MSTATPITVHVTGDAVELPPGTTVAALVERLGHRPETVAVEVDRALVPRDARSGRAFAGGERVELVTLVGGG
jgi:thiamine biosynthesis protein ThiS